MARRVTEGPLAEWYEQNPLRKWRRSSEWTFRRIAQEVDVNISEINKWETGLYIPRIPTMVRLAAMMGTTLGDLLTEWMEWRTHRPQKAVA
jgi:transcriptional regulator with XRE-family HTH domain